MAAECGVQTGRIKDSLEPQFSTREVVGCSLGKTRVAMCEYAADTSTFAFGHLPFDDRTYNYVFLSLLKL